MYIYENEDRKKFIILYPTNMPKAIHLPAVKKHNHVETYVKINEVSHQQSYTWKSPELVHSNEFEDNASISKAEVTFSFLTVIKSFVERSALNSM